MKRSYTAYGAQLVEFIRSSVSMGGEEPRPAPGSDVFNQLALNLFALQYDFVPPYRRLCDARRLRPTGVSHWTDIPALPTRAFKEFEVTSLPPEQRTHVFYSSGTTGQKSSRHFHNLESLALYDQSLGAWFRAHLMTDWPVGPGLIALTPPPEAVRHSSLVHMFETIRRSVPWRFCRYTAGVAADQTWVLNLPASLEALNQAMADNSPVLLLGTAFSFVHLLDHLIKQNLRLALPAGSRVLETGGYKGRSRTISKGALHGLITHHLGMARSWIVCEYGMSELSSQAYDHIAGNHTPESSASTPQRAFRFPPWAQVRIVSPETGEPVDEGEAGLIQVFDLANVRSVMAIQTEDLGVRRGVGFEWVGRAQLAEPRGCSLMAV